MIANINVSYASVFRIYSVANKLIKAGGEIDKIEGATYRYLYGQLDEDQQKLLEERFKEVVNYINTEEYKSLTRIVKEIINERM